MAVLLLSIIFLLSYSDRHFENTFHKVKLPMLCFPSKLIIIVLCKAWMRICFFPWQSVFLSSSLFYKCSFFSQVETKTHIVIKSEYTCDSYSCLNLISNKAKCTLVILFFSAFSFDVSIARQVGILTFLLKTFTIMLIVGRLVSCSW